MIHHTSLLSVLKKMACVSMYSQFKLIYVGQLFVNRVIMI